MFRFRHFLVSAISPGAFHDFVEFSVLRVSINNDILSNCRFVISLFFRGRFFPDLKLSWSVDGPEIKKIIFLIGFQQGFESS